MQAIRRPWNYAIVDEVDSVLIDECRNPMIMALSNKEESIERYKVAAQVSSLTAVPPCRLGVAHGSCRVWTQQLAA